MPSKNSRTYSKNVQKKEVWDCMIKHYENENENKK